MKGENYSANEYYVDESTNDFFSLHTHDEYEIYLFIDGDSKYVVEEKSYNLAPGDIVLIRKHEMHRIYHNSNRCYHRFVIMVSPAFFAKHNCTEYERAFLEENFDTGHKINADIARRIGLYDAIMRLKSYSDNFTMPDTPIANSVLVEILYLINKVATFQTADTSNMLIKNLIKYINDNFTGKITLDALAEQFYISKYHMCRAFKKETGLTVQEYIKEKRLIKAMELKSEGISLTDAAIASGFNDYSSFYRAYTQKYNHSPRNYDRKGKSPKINFRG